MDKEEKEKQRDVLSVDFSNELERVLQDLHCLGAIHPGQKLRTQDELNGLQLENGKSSLEFLFRYWNGESRVANLEAIRRLYEKGFFLLKEAVDWWETSQVLNENEPKTPPSRRAKTTNAVPLDRKTLIDRVTVKQIILRLWRALRKGETGIKQLSSTYETDASTQSSIHLLLESVSCNFEKNLVSVSYLRDPSSIHVELPDKSQYPENDCGLLLASRITGSNDDSDILGQRNIFPIWASHMPVVSLPTNENNGEVLP